MEKKTFQPKDSVILSSIECIIYKYLPQLKSVMIMS